MRARFLRQFALSAITAAGIVAGNAEHAAACSCIYIEAEDALRSADVVFEGTALAPPEYVQAQLGIEGYSGAARFRFAVARYFKGQRGEEAVLYTIDQGSACGRSYDAGTTYLVYSRLLPNGVLMDSLCSRTRPVGDAAQDLLLLGEGAPPDPNAQPRDVIAEQEEAAATGCSAAQRRYSMGESISHSSRGSGLSALSGALLCALALLRRRSVRT